jgi:hypothetical protein
MCERVNVSVQQQWDWTVAMDDAFSERFHRARSQGSNLCQTQVIGLGVPLLEHFPLDLVS